VVRRSKRQNNPEAGFEAKRNNPVIKMTGLTEFEIAAAFGLAMTNPAINRRRWVK
jgi:hypothetical protein